MSTQQDLTTLLANIYDAALGASAWDRALDDIVRATGAEAAALFIADHAHASCTIDGITLRGYPDHVPLTYAQYFGARDVRMAAAASLPAGQVYLDDRDMPFAQIERSEIYNDFYRPLRLARGMCTIPFREERRTAVASVHRAATAGEFRPEEVVLFEHLAPHITRALQLQRQVARAQAVARGLSLALDHFPMAVLLVDETAKAIEFNKAAAVLLSQAASPLRLTGGRLVASQTDHTATLRKAIAEAARPPLDPPRSPPAILRMPKTDRSGAIGLMAVPARAGGALSVLAERLALVFLSDPGATTPTSPDILIRQFGLTPTEAQIAASLARGESIEDIADARRVSRETVRVQLKSLFGKTDTGSQRHLIALLSRSLAALRIG